MPTHEEKIEAEVKDPLSFASDDMKKTVFIVYQVRSCYDGPYGEYITSDTVFIRGFETYTEAEEHIKDSKEIKKANKHWINNSYIKEIPFGKLEVDEK